MNEKFLKGNNTNMITFIDFNFSCIQKINLPKPKVQLLVSLYIAKNGNINKNKLSVRVSCRTYIEVTVFAKSLIKIFKYYFIDNNFN